MDPELDRIAAARLRSDAQRYTENRRALVAVLASAGKPLTIPEILRERPELAQSSVYRNLAVLERAGVLQRIVTTGEWARYELAEDLAGHHHHLICSACGQVVDVTLPAAVERRLDATLAEVAGQAGFEVTHHRLDLLGRCATCR